MLFGIPVSAGVARRQLQPEEVPLSVLGVVPPLPDEVLVPPDAEIPPELEAPPEAEIPPEVETPAPDREGTRLTLVVVGRGNPAASGAGGAGGVRTTLSRSFAAGRGRGAVVSDEIAERAGDPRAYPPYTCPTRLRRARRHPSKPA